MRRVGGDRHCLRLDCSTCERYDLACYAAPSRRCAVPNCDLPAEPGDVFCATCALLMPLQHVPYDHTPIKLIEAIYGVSIAEARKAVPIWDRILFRVPGVGEGFTLRDLLYGFGSAALVYAGVYLFCWLHAH